jgi:uncharacterized protein
MTEPQARRFLTARWSRLAMINYEVDPALLGSRAPRGTEVDTWNGRCFISMVGFQFLDTRVLGIAVPFHRNFVEVNLRFYVRRTVNDEVRRGVVFVKELVPRRALAWVANIVYHESYQALPMSSQDTGTRVEYSWRPGPRTDRMSVSIAGESYQPSAHSEESFITEHYWGYVTQRDGSTVEYRVEHPPWRVWRGRDSTLECDVAALYGEAFAPALAGTPSSCFLAEGSEVVVRRGRKLTSSDRSYKEW